MKGIEHFNSSILAPADCNNTIVQQFFKEQFKPLFLKKGEFLTVAGETDHKLFFIHSGLIRVFLDTMDGRQFTRTFIREGQVFFESTYYWQKLAAPSAAQALEDCEILYCDYDQLDNLSTTNIEFSKLVLAELKLYKIRHQLREFNLQSLSVEAYYKHILRDFPDVERRVKQCHIASYLGVSEVSLSRVKKIIEMKEI